MLVCAQRLLIFSGFRVYNQYRSMLCLTKSRAKRYDRKVRSRIRRARKMLEKLGLGEFDFRRNGDNFTMYKRDHSWTCLETVIALKRNTGSIFDLDNRVWYDNLEELLKERLILKLSGLGKASE